MFVGLLTWEMDFFSASGISLNNIILIILISFLISFFLYFFKEKEKIKAFQKNYFLHVFFKVFKSFDNFFINIKSILKKQKK